MAQKQDPWNRLNKTCTLSSSRREIYHNDPVAPNDSLDFVLKSQYDHHDQFLKARHETMYQPETYTENHGQVLFFLHILPFMNLKYYSIHYLYEYRISFSISIFIIPL